MSSSRSLILNQYNTISWLSKRLNKIIHAKHLTQYPVHKRCLINDMILFICYQYFYISWVNQKILMYKEKKKYLEKEYLNLNCNFAINYMVIFNKLLKLSVSWFSLGCKLSNNINVVRFLWRYFIHLAKFANFYYVYNSRHWEYSIN